MAVNPSLLHVPLRKVFCSELATCSNAIVEQDNGNLAFRFEGCGARRFPVGYLLIQGHLKSATLDIDSALMAEYKICIADESGPVTLAARQDHQLPKLSELAPKCYCVMLVQPLPPSTSKGISYQCVRITVTSEKLAPLWPQEIDSQRQHLLKTVDDTRS